MTTESEILEQARIAIQTVRSSPWGSEEYGNARSFLHKLLEADLKKWVKIHPPGTTDYDETTPRRAVYLYYDMLPPILVNSEVNDILFQSNMFEKIVTKTLQSMKASSRTSERDVVAGQYPEYLNLLKKIRETKKRWNVEDATIKRSQSFRLMGGLARLGSRAGAEYTHLVEQAQKMEKAALGKILTKYTRAS